MSRLPGKTKYTPEILGTAVAASESFSGVLRYLGLRQGGSSQAYIILLVRRFGIDTTHFKGQGWNRGVQSVRRFHWSEILVRKDIADPRTKAFLLRRALIESGVEEECTSCGLPPIWHGEPLRLHIDHIDGDFSNNEKPNLRFLCPNCHAQTSTWGRSKSALLASVAEQVYASD